mgnify:CR=1 FL=1
MRPPTLVRERVAREGRLGHLVEFGCGSGFYDPPGIADFSDLGQDGDNLIFSGHDPFHPAGSFAKPDEQGI